MESIYCDKDRKQTLDFFSTMEISTRCALFAFIVSFSVDACQTICPRKIWQKFQLNQMMSTCLRHPLQYPYKESSYVNYQFDTKYRHLHQISRETNLKDIGFRH